MTPVAAVDGRAIGAVVPGPVTERLDSLYRDLLAAEGS